MYLENHAGYLDHYYEHDLTKCVVSGRDNALQKKFQINLKMADLWPSLTWIICLCTWQTKPFELR